MPIPLLGLDVGGANLKAAHTDGTARTVPFALWQEPERLPGALARLCSEMPAYRGIALTMTGELCDCFASKREGVAAILQSARQASGETSIRVWSTSSCFLDLAEAMENPLRVAAANWLALAYHVGRLFPGGTVLLIDTGSTTTDITYLNHGVPEPRGLTDPARLASGELVYTGVRRTPICAVLGTQVAAEFFATMHDAYVLLGMVPTDAGDCGTADGRPATPPFALARLARMRCADVETFSEGQARNLAEQAVAAQWHAVHEAIVRVVADRAPVDRIVLAGSGEILGRSVVDRYPAWSKLPVTSLTQLRGASISEAACAYAVAMLAQGEPEVCEWPTPGRS